MTGHDAPRTIRLATFNARHGAPPGGRADVGRFAAAVGQLDADVLALQEVERSTPRSRGADLVAVAGAALDAPWHHFSPTVRGVPGTYLAAGRAGRGARRWPGYPGHGIGLVSRFPVDRWLRLELPRMAWRDRVRRSPEGSALPVRVVPDEPRVALAAVLRTPAGPLTVVTTHLTSRVEHTATQLGALVRACAALPGPLVLIGDLNLRPPDVARISGWRPLAVAHTHPAGRPVRQIDHVLAADRGLAPVGTATAVDTGVSDHRALAVEVLSAV
ncbi:endonuclease/exonuclease/phosphatase family protein [Cellulosimicrobium arenosum]|uniref:endonuclease/exonuclease/phosphatase family protein n=1 Tax=Cellulosimicrobium arenosum TaxID=2708133 RepID=UPI0030CA29E5